MLIPTHFTLPVPQTEHIPSIASSQDRPVTPRLVKDADLSNQALQKAATASSCTGHSTPDGKLFLVQKNIKQKRAINNTDANEVAWDLRVKVTHVLCHATHYFILYIRVLTTSVQSTSCLMTSSPRRSGAAQH